MNSILFKMGLLSRIAAGTAILILAALPAQAQFVPGPYYSSDMGVLGSATAAYQSATQQQAYSNYRQMGAASSMAHSMAWMNINRNMQAEAASSPATVPDAAQAARDWMYQQSSYSRPSPRPTSLPSTSLSYAAPQRPVVQQPEKAAPKEIMLWPTVLKDKRYAKERTAVESPFRRAYADKKPLTVKDYEMIILVLEKMKVGVEGMKAQLVETEYDSVQQYLDDLIADAEKRIKAREEDKG
jgi:hypothetical protein